MTETGERTERGRSQLLAVAEPWLRDFGVWHIAWWIALGFEVMLAASLVTFAVAGSRLEAFSSRPQQ